MQEIHVNFASGSPSVARLLKAFQTRTGLHLNFDFDDSGGVLHSERFNCGLWFDRSDKTIIVGGASGSSSFPLWGLISALMHLGGSYEGRLPRYAHMRWDELSPELKEEVKRHSLDGFPNGAS